MLRRPVKWRNNNEVTACEAFTRHDCYGVSQLVAKANTLSPLIPSIFRLLYRNLFLATVERTTNRLRIASGAELAAEDADSFFACAVSLVVLPIPDFGVDELEEAEKRWVRLSSSKSA